MFFRCESQTTFSAQCALTSVSSRCSNEKDRVDSKQSVRSLLLSLFWRFSYLCAFRRYVGVSMWRIRLYIGFVFRLVSHVCVSALVFYLSIFEYICIVILWMFVHLIFYCTFLCCFRQLLLFMLLKCKCSVSILFVVIWPKRQQSSTPPPAQREHIVFERYFTPGCPQPSALTLTLIQLVFSIDFLLFCWIVGVWNCPQIFRVPFLFYSLFYSLTFSETIIKICGFLFYGKLRVV